MQLLDWGWRRKRKSSRNIQSADVQSSLPHLPIRIQITLKTSSRWRELCLCFKIIAQSRQSISARCFSIEQSNHDVFQSNSQVMEHAFSAVAQLLLIGSSLHCDAHSTGNQLVRRHRLTHPADSQTLRAKHQPCIVDGNPLIGMPWTTHIFCLQLLALGWTQFSFAIEFVRFVKLLISQFDNDPTRSSPSVDRSTINALRVQTV